MTNFQITSYKHFTSVMSSFTEALQIVFIKDYKDWLEMQVFCCGGGIFSNPLKKEQYQVIESELVAIYNYDLTKVAEMLSHSAMRHCLDDLDESSTEIEIRERVKGFFNNN